MNGILPPAVELAAKQARSQAIAEYFESGGSADDTSAEGITGQIPLLHLVLSASPRDGVPKGLIGDRLEEAVRAVLDGGPRDVDVRWRGRTPLHTAVESSLGSTHVPSTFLGKQLNIIAMLVEAGADVNAGSATYRYRSEVLGSDGRTPLMVAAEGGVGYGMSRTYAIIRLLLTLGARVDICDDAGRTVDSILAGHRFFKLKRCSRSSKEDVLKAFLLVADVRAAGGTWARYIHEPRVRLDGLRQLCCQGRATPQTYFFLGLPWTHMRARRRNQNFLARLFTALPADVFRHMIGFWRSDRDDAPEDSDSDTPLADAAEAAEAPVPQLQGTTREERVESLWTALGH